MREYQTLHLDTNEKKKRKNIAFMAVLHFTVTVGPSKMTIVPLNEYEMYSVERYSVSLSSE